MKNILLITASQNSDSLGRKALPYVKEGFAKADVNLIVEDLRDYRPFWMTPNKLLDTPVEYRELARKIKESDSVVFLAPIYAYGISSAIKSLVELYTDELHRMPIAFITSSGTSRSFMADGNIKQNLAHHSEAFCFPKSVQISYTDVSEEGQISHDCQNRISELTENFSLFTASLKHFRK